MKKSSNPIVAPVGTEVQKQKHKRMAIGLTIGLILLCYFTFHVTKAVEEYGLVEGLNIGMTNALKHPTAFLPLDKNQLLATVYIMFIFLLIAAVIWIDGRRRHHDLAGIEQGSAKWNDDIEGYKKAYMSPVYAENMLFSNDIGLNMDGTKTFRNNNVLVIGGSGTGKTRYVLKPNLMQCNCSYIITDPSGDILTDIAPVLEKNGYIIKVFNVNEMSKSMCYNPLSYIRDEAGVAMLVNCLIKNTGESGGENKFWDQAITALLEAIILFLLKYCPKEEQNFSHVMKLLRAADIADERQQKSSLDIVFEQVEKQDPNDLSLKFYKTFKMSAGKTLKNILISASVRLTVFNFPSVISLTDIDTLDLTSIGDEKQALFIITPQADDTYSFLVAMMYSQLFESLYHHAEYECGGLLIDKDDLTRRPFPTQKDADDFKALLIKNAECIRRGQQELLTATQSPYTGRYVLKEKKTNKELMREVRPEILRQMLENPESFTTKSNGKRCPFHVRMLMDEFANLGEVPNFERVIATVRRYNISTTVILQSITQIKAMYEKTYETIIACCDSLIFLGSSEMTTVKTISDILGSRTITVQGHGRSTGKSPSGSENYSQQKRELMTPNELIMMDRNNAVVSINGIYPFLIQKFDLKKHPNYDYIADSGKVSPYVLEDHFNNTELLAGVIETEEAKEVGKEERVQRVDAAKIAEDAVKVKKSSKQEFTVNEWLTNKPWEKAEVKEPKDYQMTTNEFGEEDFMLATHLH